MEIDFYYLEEENIGRVTWIEMPKNDIDRTYGESYTEYL